MLFSDGYSSISNAFRPSLNAFFSSALPFHRRLTHFTQPLLTSYCRWKSSVGLAYWKSLIDSQKEEIVDKTLGIDILSKAFVFFDECLGHDYGLVVAEYKSLVRKGHLSNVRRDCKWSEEVNIVVVPEDTHITYHVPKLSLIYPYSFSTGFYLLKSEIVKEFCRRYQVCVAQVTLQVWRLSHNSKSEPMMTPIPTQSHQ